MKTFLLDLDGTMYRGTELIPSAKRFIDRCQKENIPYIFLTNNAMRTRHENVVHMEKMGYRNLKDEDFFNSAMAASQYVRRKYNFHKAYYIGGAGMEQALLEENFEIVDTDPEVVFVGLDKTMNYSDYSKALGYLLNGAILVGTNEDRVLAKPGGFEIGNGSVVAMFEYASGQRSPHISKPYSPILELCLEKFGLQKEDVILVGDNLETDIKLGYTNHVETIFVETGVHTRKDLERFDVQPSHVVHTLDDIDLQKLKK